LISDRIALASECEVFLVWKPDWNHRAGGIRTRGLLHPRQALYQAEPQPELVATLKSNAAGLYFAYSNGSGKIE
jgi:hypothetical protein